MKNFNSISEILETQSVQYKNKVFVKFKEKKITFEEFNNIVISLSLELRKLGIKKGDIFCLMTGNCPEFIFTWFALNRLGAIMTPINPSYKEAEVNYILMHTQTNFCLVDETTKDVVEKTKYNCTIITLDELKKLCNSNIKSSFKKIKHSQDDIAAILYTSGTTGDPKGVMLSNRSYIVGGESFAFRAAIAPSDNVMAILPLFHVNAEVYSTMGALITGATLILEPRFSASMFWEDVFKKNVTHVNLLGVIAHILLKTPFDRKYKHNSIKVAFGGDLDIETIKRFKSKFGIDLLQPLSLTECPMGTSNTTNDNKIGSVGKPARHPNPNYFTEVKIVDDSDNEVENNNPGEILFRSPAMAQGYYKNPQATSQSFKNGWFYTGDYGKKDDEGYVYFIDRKKDIIRKKGESISSREIEIVLSKISAIDEVAIVPIPSSFGGENIKGYIVLHPNMSLTMDCIKKYCKNRLASYKIPDIIEFVDELPKTATHKVNKSKLKEKNIVFNNSNSSEIYVLAGVRTPMGKFYGKLREITANTLITHCMNYLSKTYSLNTLMKL